MARIQLPLSYGAVKSQMSPGYQHQPSQDLVKASGDSILARNSTNNSLPPPVMESGPIRDYRAYASTATSQSRSPARAVTFL